MRPAFKNGDPAIVVPGVTILVFNIFHGRLAIVDNSRTEEQGTLWHFGEAKELPVSCHSTQDAIAVATAMVVLNGFDIVALENGQPHLRRFTVVEAQPNAGN